MTSSLGSGLVMGSLPPVLPLLQLCGASRHRKVKFCWPGRLGEWDLCACTAENCGWVPGMYICSLPRS